MSSAALQTAPHQPTTVSSHSPVPATAASSNRAYTSAPSQPRDPYYSQTASNASPSSNRRTSRRPSGNGASNNNNNPQQQQQDEEVQAYYHSSSGTAANAASMTSRVANPSSHASSPVTTAASPATGYPAMMAPGDHQRGVPPVVSPRTSSNRNAVHANAAATERSSRRERYAPESTTSPRISSREGRQDRDKDREDRQRSNGNTQVNGADRGPDDPAAASRARRRAQPQSGEALPHRPSGTRDSRSGQASPAQRPSAGRAHSSSGVSRDGGEILNRVVVSKPEVDIDRERERMAEAVPSSPASQAIPRGGLAVVGSEGIDDERRGTSRSRHDHSSSKREKNSKFGDYYLGNTLGEGEFGKVKMGWKQEGGVQVAIKLIRRDSVGTNPTRLAKIYREIAILREISHPNIVRLHEMVETEKQIGIILEYASGGELFDYILNHRYLKDNAARRLFAQLVSGVGYLHKKGIVHRDLKLENLLLDRNRNIIITDFGFANTFSADDELGEEIEYNLSSRDFVKRMDLDKILPNGYRRGDLMQTSCGSPCYAAPELVVSDSLYTGRKVDVWSCGVILYAMLAGYLPFDDDPANPEGDNINLLYKYIVSTPLTFPEYVTPHARDLLRRILVPDPRKRADLFEVARHSWLSEYSHVVGFITSSTSTTQDIAKASIGTIDQQEAPHLARSASVREPSKTQKSPPAVGDLSRKHGNLDPDASEAHPKPQKDNKRRTVQVEYVAPRSQTQRGEQTTATAPSGPSRTRARAGSGGPVEVQPIQPTSRRTVSVEKPLPQDPPKSRDAQYSNQARRPSSSQRQQGMPPPSRPGREPPRSVSDHAHIASLAGPPVSIARPNTGGSMTSTGSRPGTLPLNNRGSYSQPAAPTVAGTNAHGRMSQPQNYNISGQAMQDGDEYGRPDSRRVPAKFAKVAGLQEGAAVPEQKGHKRSNTIGGFFSRSNSVFGGKSGRKDVELGQDRPEKQKKYPPVSMSGAIGHGQTDTPRQSMDSRRSISFGFGKKRSGSMTGSQTTLQEKPRRFSLLPSGFSLKAIGIGKDYVTPGAPASDQQFDSRPNSRGNYLGPPQSARTDPTRNISGATAIHPSTADGSYDYQRDSPVQDYRGPATAIPAQPRYASHGQASDPRSGAPPQFLPPLNFRQEEAGLTTESESSLTDFQNQRGAGAYPTGFNAYETDHRPAATSRGGNGRGVLQKNNRKFTDAYDQEVSNGYRPTHVDHAGTSSAARKVMDAFRRLGRSRGGER
ncbi:Protein kinase-like (PK-like) [Venustampulla echinocandica]|uniref:non-specific serine/threonine protein kinase n=1 Tax=Venustampulla echinocandica TaxID=2656787 RepID=A0A370U3J3_9HELO|nr:Protein kinase-like (PK-like) [Venustampulla echinocandica]RDL42351.1 Protein kinase-like (PK-like) [Venustampulla echinocandica]